MNPPPHGFIKAQMPGFAYQVIDCPIIDFIPSKAPILKRGELLGISVIARTEDHVISLGPFSPL